MPSKKSKFESATERATLILQEHLDSLPLEMSKQKRAQFHQLTQKMKARTNSARLRNGKFSAL
jgi:hypothetical protein